MILFADIATIAGKFAPALALGVVGIYFLLPKPRARSVTLGTFLSLAAMVHLGVTFYELLGSPTPDLVGDILFWLFSGVAVFFGGVLVTQRNPARGAIAFAFVILSTCGLFLMLAAPFLMAATLIIYAGAIIVTFLFVLMLSHTGGPSNENDRTREPMLGSLAGFAFTGLVLLTLYLGSPVASANNRDQAAALPVAPLTEEHRELLRLTVKELDEALASSDDQILETRTLLAREHLDEVVGYSPGEHFNAQFNPIQQRLFVSQNDPRIRQVIDEANQVRDQKKIVIDTLDNTLLGGDKDRTKVKAELKTLRDASIRLAGYGQLPARNVTAIGLSLYSEHLIAVELAGTLLLVATIGAVTIARKKGVSA